MPLQPPEKRARRTFASPQSQHLLFLTWLYCLHAPKARGATKLLPKLERHKSALHQTRPQHSEFCSPWWSSSRSQNWSAGCKADGGAGLQLQACAGVLGRALSGPTKGPPSHWKRRSNGYPGARGTGCSEAGFNGDSATKMGGARTGKVQVQRGC